MNSAYNFPCLYSLFAPLNDKKTDDCMLKIVQSLTEKSEDVQMYVGAFMHDVLTVAIDNGKDPIEFVDSIKTLLKSEFISVQTSVLPNLGLTLNTLNRYFKHEII